MSDSEDPFEVSGLAGDSAFDDSTSVMSAVSQVHTVPLKQPKPQDTSGNNSKLRSLDAASAVDCPVCGKSNASDYRFCRGCGSEADSGDAGAKKSSLSPPPPSSSSSSSSSSGARGRVSSSSEPDSSAAPRRPAGRARPPPKPPGAAEPPLSAAAATSLEERRAARTSVGPKTTPPPPAAAAASAAAPSSVTSSSVSAPKKESTTSSAASFSAATVPTPKKISEPTSPTAASFSSATVPTPKKIPESSSASSPPGLPPGKRSLGDSGSAQTLNTSAASTKVRPGNDSSSSLPQATKVSAADSSSKHATPVGEELLMSRTADESTRQFLLEVVRSHEEGIRDGEMSSNSAGTNPTASEMKKKPRAPTLKLKGTWSKASGAPKKGLGDVMSWSSLGLDVLAEQEGGMPQAVFQCTQYFLEKRCYNYPGLFKLPGSPLKVNQIMDALADGSFQSFDSLEVTPLDVLQSLKTFLLIVPEPPVPCSLFFELLDACYEVSKEKQVVDVRNLLMRVSSACRGIARSVIDLCRKVLASQPGLQMTDVAQFLGSALVRPSEGLPAETDPQCYAITLSLLELGDAAFDAKAVPERPTPATVTLPSVPSQQHVAEMEALNEELKTANEKVASLTRQLDEARKGQVVLKKKLDVMVKENGELKRKLADSQKIIDSWKANAVMDMY